MGANWSLISTAYAFNFLCNMFFVNDSIGYVCGFFQIQKTIDGGITWSPQSSTGDSPNFWDWVSDVFFLNVDTGFAVGYGVYYRMPLGTLIGVASNFADKSGLTIYPNPTTDKITIEFPSFKTEQTYYITLYSSHGQFVSRQLIRQRKTKIDLSTLDTGVYILNVLGSDVNMTKTIIKE